MRLLTTRDWTVKRGWLLAGIVVAACALLSILLPSWILYVLAAVVALSFLVPSFRHPTWVYIAVWAMAFLCLFGQYQRSSVEPLYRLTGEQDVITAQIVELPSSGRMVTAQILDADKLPRGSRVLLYCNEQVSPKQHEIVRASVELKALYATQQWHRADQVFLQAYPLGYDEQAMTVMAAPRSWYTLLSPLRERLTENIRTRLNGEEGALLAGICLGDKSEISASTMTAFRRTGMPHILVVSGLHLSAISSGIYMLLRWILSHRRAAALLTMAAVGFFMALVGFTPSVVRARVMCLVMLSGQLFTRRADGLNSMGFAMVLLLAANPYSLLDAGLQLSFGAAGGVICLTKPLQERLYRLKLWPFAADSLAVTLAATLPIMPLLGLLFGEVSLVSPLANLLAVAPASAALVLGWIGMLLSLCPPLAFLANGVLYLAGWLVRLPMLVAQLLGALPLATVSTERVWTILYLTGGCGLVILCLYKIKRGILRRLVPALAVILLLACGADRLLHRDTTIVTVTRRGDGAVLMLEQDGRYGLLAQDVSGIYVSDALVRACRGTLDFVVIGGTEPKNSAYLTELLHRVEVKRILVVGKDALFLDVPTESFAEGRACELWIHTALTVDAESGWQLSCRGTTLAIAPEKACVADGAIFVGALPTTDGTMMVGQGILLTEKDAAAAVAELPYPTTVVTEESVYLITRGGGEWSVRRWR